jgi:hypothetical protein
MAGFAACIRFIVVARETQYFVAFGSKHDMRAIPLEQRHAQILLELAHGY